MAACPRVQPVPRGRWGPGSAYPQEPEQVVLWDGQALPRIVALDSATSCSKIWVGTEGAKGLDAHSLSTYLSRDMSCQEPW